MAFVARPATEEQILVQRISSRGWRAETVEERAGWLLRANRGWTGRANSALPLTSSHPAKMASEGSLETLHEFFARRGLPVRVQVPLPACAALDEELARRGFESEAPTHVLTARVEDVVNGGPGAESVRVEVSSAPDEEWFAACERWARGLGAVGRSLIERHPRAGFASIRGADGATIAVGRVVVDDGWAGLSTSAVHPEHRGRGLGTALLRARLRWAGREHGATRAYLQVEKRNAASLGLCLKAGFAFHHYYHYRVRRP